MACALGVRRAFYQRFAVLAAASGYEVLLFSYRGSEGDDPAVASYRLADWGREDIDAALAWCRARAPELPRYFVGHSIGAQLLGLAGQASGLSGAAFVAGSFPYWRRWRGRQRWQMFGLFCVAVPLLTGLLRRFPSRFFGLGSLDMPSHFMRDWARWVRQPDYLLAPRFGLQRQGYEALDIPVASFLFEDDDYVPWAAAEKLHQVYAAAHLELRRKGRAEGRSGISGCSATRRCRRSCSTTSGSCPTRRKPRPSMASVAGGDRAARVGDPLAPRAGVEARKREAGEAQGEQVVAGGDAGAAVGDQLVHRATAQQGGEPQVQLFRRKEAAVAAKVVGEGGALGTGNVSGDRIYGLDFATEARLRASIEQRQSGLAQLGLEGGGVDQQRGIGLALEIAGSKTAFAIGQCQPRSLPGRQATIEEVDPIALAQPCNSHQARAANAPGPSS